MSLGQVAYMPLVASDDRHHIEQKRIYEKKAEITGWLVWPMFFGWHQVDEFSEQNKTNISNKQI